MPRLARTPSYAQRIDRVLDHVAEQVEGQRPLDLASLARVAGFSPYHFHRVFQAHTGETVHGHVRRVRVERAASLMRTSRARLTDIALQCGFPALSDLSRAFKAHYGIAPSAWDRASPLPASVQASGEHHAMLTDDELAAKGRGLRVRLAELPRSLFVYVRVFDPYGSPKLVDAYHAVRGWLAAIDRDPRDVIFAGMSLDDPAVVAAAQCRYDLGCLFPFTATGVAATIGRLRGAAIRPALPSPADIPPTLSSRRFPAMEAATLHVTGDLGAVDVAWQWLYRRYLPSQRRLPLDQPALELFVRLPEEIGWERFDLLACVPLRG